MATYVILSRFSLEAFQEPKEFKSVDTTPSAFGINEFRLLGLGC